MNGIIILIVILAFISLGIYLIATSDDILWKELTGGFNIMIFGIIFIFHIIFWSASGYQYEIFIKERSAFEVTLDTSREKERIYENAAIISKVTEWNSELSVMKYDNSLWLFDCYIDDRIEKIEFIN